MTIPKDTLVMLPGYAPYPRYGRVDRYADAENVVVNRVQCGDPRCAAEHTHGDVVWRAAELEATQAYQPRAGWELGRRSSPNAPIAE